MKKLIYLLILISLFAQAQNNGNGNANGSGGNGGNDDSPHVFKNNTQGFVYDNLGTSFVTSCGITDKFMKDTLSEAIGQMKNLDNALRQLNDKNSKCNSIVSGSDPLSSTIEALNELSKEDAGHLDWKKHAASMGPKASPELLKLIRPEQQIPTPDYNEMMKFQNQLNQGQTLDATKSARYNELKANFEKKSRENALLYAGAQMGATVTNLVATGCLKELFSKSTNDYPAGAKVMNALGTFGEVGSNIMMNISGIVPALAPFALGVKLASAGFRALGSLIAKRRPVNKQTFHKKTCAFKNYLETRSKAKCINGCDKKVESIKKAISETQKFKNALNCKEEINSLDQNISSFMVDFDEHVKKLPTIQNIDNEPMGTGEFLALRDMIGDDQLRLEQEMGLDGSIPNMPYQLSDLMRVDGGTEIQMKRYDFDKEPLKDLVSKITYKPHLKQQLDLMMSPAGIAMTYFCGARDDNNNYNKPLKNSFFKDQFGIKDQEEINKDCENVQAFASCANKEGTNSTCKNTVTNYSQMNGSDINSFVSKGTLNLLNTLNYHRLSNELGHPKCKNNPSPTDCPAMTRFSVKEPVTAAYARLTSGDLSLGFSHNEKQAPLYVNYSLYRKKIFERDNKVKVASSTYNDYTNLSAATSELNSLQKLAAIELSADNADKFDQEVKSQAEKKLTHCFGSNDTEIITQLNGGIILGDPDKTEDSPGSVFDSNWKNFFEYETASADDTPITDDSGNYGVALSKILRGISPWKGEREIKGDDLKALQKQTCGNLYCVLKANEQDFHEDDYKKSKFVKGTKDMKAKIFKSCEKVMGDEFECSNDYCHAVLAKIENDVKKLSIFTPKEENSWNEKLADLKACIEE